uniref:Uncharacterized protein n=1 Tax=Nelumbo nucifera TaxID=4432 RepID=A0A822XGY1_NELNU|nr:TPA_asm: hypothetical protein HUJ06_022207 [Nelumbo nucifera]
MDISPGNNLSGDAYDPTEIKDSTSSQSSLPRGVSPISDNSQYDLLSFNSRASDSDTKGLLEASEETINELRADFQSCIVLPLVPNNIQPPKVLNMIF